MMNISTQHPTQALHVLAKTAAQHGDNVNDFSVNPTIQDNSPLAFKEHLENSARYGFEHMQKEKRKMMT